VLEQPDVDDTAVVACLRDHYGVVPTHLTFLPLGADAGTAVYRAVAADGTAYFVKLRRVFDAAAVAIPHFLRSQGVDAVMAPMTTGTGELSAGLDGLRLTLFPYVDGHNAVEVPLSDAQWRAFGAALKAVHTVALPPELRDAVPRERFAPQLRDAVTHWLRVADAFAHDPVARRLADALRTRRAQIDELVRRAARLAAELAARPRELVLCHSDVHAANLLVDDGGERLYIVDWDEPVLAPKERDLMFIGGGVCGGWDTPREDRLFYAGYGTVNVDPVALAYYRFERIVADIAAECDEVFLTAAGDDREQSVEYFERQFEPGGVREIAHATAANLL
jgi:spectinomycin phosphotransferase